LTHRRFIAGGKAVAAICSAEDGETIVKTAVEKFGTVHVLVANAGILRDKSFLAMTEQEWDIVLAVHLRFVTSVPPIWHTVNLWTESGVLIKYVHILFKPYLPITMNSDSAPKLAGPYSRSRNLVVS
jgi:NAD(P)-dependent dehydrogenase (short-subunit alcohol dehydrogenase family)